MAENKDLELAAAQHEFDENENPSSLNFNSLNNTVNDSFNMINCESEKYLSESQNVSADALISSGLSTPRKNALVDSGFHCENLEKTVLPDLVNNSLCESVDNELANGIHEKKQDYTTSGVSFCSINDNSFNSPKDNTFNTAKDNSFNTSKDASFNPNTTTNNIALLFERLTLNSDGNTSRCNDLENSSTLESDTMSEKIFNDNLMPSEVSLNENFKHPDVSFGSDGSKLKSSDISVSPDNSVIQPSPGPEANKVPPDETFDSPSLANPSPGPEANKVPLDETFATPSLLQSSPMTELNKVPLDETYTDPSLSQPSPVTELNKVPRETFATPSLLHPSPVPELNKVPHDETFTAPSLSEPSPVPDMNKMPFDETFTAPNPAGMSIDTEIESFDSNRSKIINSDCPFSPETSPDEIFKRPFPVPESSNGSNIQNMSADNVFVGNPVDNFDGEEFQDAVQFFKDPSSFQVFEDIKAGDSYGTSMPRDSLYMNFDPLYKSLIQPASVTSTGKGETDNGDYVEEEICAENTQFFNKHVSNVPPRESLRGNLVSFDSPIKSNYAEKSEDLIKESTKEEIRGVSQAESNQPFDSSIKNETDNKCRDVSKEFLNGGICDEDNDENIRQFVNKHITNVPVRESLSGNLLSFDSPMKSNSARTSEIKEGVLQGDQKLYTEEEFQQALKIYELTMQEAFLKKQREIEEEALKKQKETENEVLKKQKEIEEILKKQKEMEEELKKQKLEGETFKKEKEIEEETSKKQKEIEEETSKKQKELEEENSRKQKELEEETSKKQKELEEESLNKENHTAKKLHQVTELCKVLLETVSEFATIATEQNTKIGDLSARIINLDLEKQKLDSDLKTSTEDLQSVEHTFSDFHKRYVQCKDMLKSYKDNEDRLKTQYETLSKKLEEQEQMYSVLQAKMGEVVDKANAEVASAKKGGDAQVAVLKAQLKKSELKVSSLESDLKQVRIENDKLSGICDDLMAKVSEA